VWSFVVVVYECLTGKFPFEAKTGPALIATICTKPALAPSSFTDLPPGLDGWFARGLKQSIEDREASVQRLADDFLLLSELMKGRCEVAADSLKVSKVIAYASTLDSTSRRRVPSSIPAAINDRRDIDHIALISRIGRKSAVLWTRQRCVEGQQMKLTLRAKQGDEGISTLASVHNVSEQSVTRPDLWRYEVEVAFAEPLAIGDDELAKLAAG
jgi:hypothetical protein